MRRAGPTIRRGASAGRMLPSSTMHVAAFALALLVTLLLAGRPASFEGPALSARSARAQELPPADPTRAGPYPVGVTRRTFTRASSATGQPRSLETVIWYPAHASSLSPDPVLEGT